MSLSWLPNAITVSRMVLALPLLWALAVGQYMAAFWIAAVAAASDGVDGWLAKHRGWHSRLGSLLDPVADKLLLCVCFVGLWWSARLPGWLVALVLGRDLVILGGAAAWWARFGPFTATPTPLSKLNTVLQLSLAVLVLFDAAFAGRLADGAGRHGPLPLVWLQALLLACAALTVASGVDYVVRWGARFHAASGKGQ
jgi:cardiolipin synthase